jgi:hypothetical protein
MKHIIAKGRRMGKSSLMDSILNHHVNGFRKAIDKSIIDDIWGAPINYRLRKSWRDRRGRQMHRVDVNDEIYNWLSTVHNQYGKSNPEWWKFEDKINISDKLYLMLVLKFGEGD